MKETKPATFLMDWRTSTAQQDQKQAEQNLLVLSLPIIY